MLKQLVDVVSALLLIGLTLGALFPATRLATGRDPARPDSRPVLWGALIGAFLGLVMILVHHNSLIRFNRQMLTLTTLLPTVLLGLAVVVLTWIFSRRTVRILNQQGDYTAAIDDNLVSRPIRLTIIITSALWAVMVVFRQTQSVYMQVLTFVPVGATVFSTTTFLNVVGYILGICLVIVAAVSVARICQINPRLTQPLLTVLVILTSLSHIFLIIRLLHAMRVIYVPTSAAAGVAWLINHEAWNVILALVITSVVAILTWIMGRKIPIEGSNPAIERTHRATSLRMTRRAALGLATYAIATTVLTVGVKYATEEVELSEPEPFEVDDQNAIISLDTINDGHLHRYVYKTSSGVEVRWIVIQKAGSSYGVGLDACEICGPSGYYEKNGQVICKLCSVAMNIATIGFPGGCNPIPIEYEVSNNVLTIPLTELEDSAEVFA